MGEVTSWEGVSDHSHRFGGIEFRLGRIELGQTEDEDEIEKSSIVEA